MRTIAVALVLTLALPLATEAAPPETVVIAQGVDISTLDMMNQADIPTGVAGRSSSTRWSRATPR